MSRKVENHASTLEGIALKREAEDPEGRILVTVVGGISFCFYVAGKRLMDVRTWDAEGASRVGNVYVGRVTKVSKDLEALFVAFSKEETGFLPMSKLPKEYEDLKEGDLLPVQMTAEAQRGKRPSLSARIRWTNWPEGEALRQRAAHLEYGSLLAKAPDPLSEVILQLFAQYPVREIVTDRPEWVEVLKEAQEGVPVRLYADASFSMEKLYGLKTKLQEALSRKVWLSSGGFLMIDHTEAMTVIDVNSGKHIGARHQTSADFYLKSNLEAAAEIALQIRLRNLSGMILVDFINLESDSDREKLLEFMRESVSKDNVQTKVWDITALGIMEITRQKKDKPLRELCAKAMFNAELPHEK